MGIKRLCILTRSLLVSRSSRASVPQNPMSFPNRLLQSPRLIFLCIASHSANHNCGKGREVAKVLFIDSIVSRGVYLDSFLLDSTVISYWKLRELEEAKTHFDRLISMKSIHFRGACNALLEELYSTLLGSMTLVVFWVIGVIICWLMGCASRDIQMKPYMGTFNCGAFVAGIVRGVLDGAGFLTVVAAHFVPAEGQQ
ncbi:hypothetical protein LOK49_LG04G00797 [Camellia lanceoleosa]|uniref:Uncharacterized protein n=1 Tax=Camellia lanceoleosa TaxID=1840588 RepID=A0ACC0HYJ1_9ERIC|nr:hypothetical protein LOK49_LG04G00797 [Camellia lanceoleosa]